MCIISTKNVYMSAAQRMHHLLFFLCENNESQPQYSDFVDQIMKEYCRGLPRTVWTDVYSQTKIQPYRPYNIYFVYMYLFYFVGKQVLYYCAVLFGHARCLRLHSLTAE